jgi:adenylate kinase
LWKVSNKKSKIFHRGTQCSVIQEKFGLVHLSSGDMLRDSIRKKTESGLKAEKFINNGELVPDELIMNLVFERLNQEDVKKNGYLLDGFPRNATQAKSLIDNNLAPDVVILLDVSDEEVTKRIGGRRCEKKYV